MTEQLTKQPAEGRNARPRPERGEKPLVEIHAGPGGISRQAIAETWAYREVLGAFAVRYIKVRYKQAAIGVGWAVLQPVLSALVFALVFGRYAGLPSEGTSYLVFALAGMVLWTYFSTWTTTASQSLADDQGLIRKVFFPREVVPLGGVLAGLLDLACALFVLLVVLLVYGEWPALPWLLFPVPVLIVVLTAAALSLTFGALNVYYRDIRYLLPFLLQVGLFASAVIYPLRVFPAAWRNWYAVLNPMAGAIDSFRRMLTLGEWPDFAVLGGALLWSIVLFVASYALFKRLERTFADRV
jgi:lipopolysaccharide transport system permease protein